MPSVFIDLIRDEGDEVVVDGISPQKISVSVV